MTELTRSERMRRPAVVCFAFIRNVTYYLAGHRRLTDSEFWRTVNGNFLDVAVLEWCKLFGDKKEYAGWREIVGDQTRFETELLAHVGVTGDQFEELIKSMRTYRDKFVAHLDLDRTMYLPMISTQAKAAVEFYHAYVLAHEGAGVTWGPLLGGSIGEYEKACAKEATAVYGKHE